MLFVVLEGRGVPGEKHVGRAAQSPGRLQERQREPDQRRFLRHATSSVLQGNREEAQSLTSELSAS